MKAMSSHTLFLVLSVIFLVILLGVGVFWVQSAGAPEQWEKVWELGSDTGSPSGVGYEQPISKEYGFIENLEVDRPISDSDGPHRFSEVACAIANDIFDDFSEKDIDSIRSNCVLGTPTNKEQCKINAGVFKYQKGTTTPPAWWETNLTNDYPDCHVCPIEDFDEVCINYNLKDRLVGASSFCDGYFSINGGVRFGNCDCGKNRNSDSWNDQCDGDYCCHEFLKCFFTCNYMYCDNDGVDDICDNKEDMIKWLADSNGPDKWKVKDDNSISYGDHKGNSNLLSEDYDYIYGVFWVPSKETYLVTFYRLPEKGHVESSFDFISDLLAKSEKFYRINPLGIHYADARTITDVEVTGLANDKTVQDLLAEIESRTGLKVLEGEIKCVRCLSEDCIPREPTRIERQCGTIGVYGTPDISGESFFLDEPITIYTNMTDPNGCNGQFSKDKNYRVIIKNWWGKYERNAVDCYESFERTVSILEVS